MKKITLSLFILFTSIIYSQKGDAILILKDSSTIKGSGEISGILSKVAINFGNDSLKFRTYRSKEIIGIDILENNYYRKFRFKYIDKDKFPEILEIISIDNLSLYCKIYENQNSMGLSPTVYHRNGHVNYAETFRPNSTRDQKSLYIGKNKSGESTISQISYYIGEFQNDRVQHLFTKGLPFALRFKKAMTKYFKDCESLIEKVNSKEFTKDEIIEVFEYYKSNCYNIK